MKGLSRSLSRRSFLVLTGGVVLLAACGGDDDSEASDESSATGNRTFTEVAPGIVSSDLYASPEPQRFAFALLAKEGYASGGQVRVALAAPGAEPTEFVEATARAEGLPEFRGVYTIEATLPTSGTWQGALEYEGARTPFVFEVGARAAVPAAGTSAPRAASPTVTEALGVDPLCTREPPCSLHDRSLDTLIGAGRPVAVLFATPARCQTQYCGPVLETLLPLVAEYRDRVDIVHVEIYRDSRSEVLVPTVESWELPSEPWFFGIDGAGTIVARLDGAFDRSELRAVLDQLVPA
ncbi:MAG: hypothetical protein ACT4OX_17190 [Actinomycetota bacterium]